VVPWHVQAPMMTLHGPDSVPGTQWLCAPHASIGWAHTVPLAHSACVVHAEPESGGTVTSAVPLSTGGGGCPPSPAPASMPGGGQFAQGKPASLTGPPSGLPPSISLPTESVLPPHPCATDGSKQAATAA
jgi:hypothetical protein